MNEQRRMQSLRIMVVGAQVLIILGLGASAPGYAEPQNNSKPAQACMTLPPSTKATVTDTANGSAIELTASGDPTNVRSYAQRMAQMYNHMVGMQSGMPMRGSGMGGMGMHGPGMHGGMMGGAPMHLVSSQASAENTTAGARIVLVPNDASQRTALRDQARRQAMMIQQGECPLRQPAAG
jgi:hypothetical protein